MLTSNLAEHRREPRFFQIINYWPIARAGSCRGLLFALIEVGIDRLLPHLHIGLCIHLRTSERVSGSKPCTPLFFLSRRSPQSRRRSRRFTFYDNMLSLLGIIHGGSCSATGSVIFIAEAINCKIVRYVSRLSTAKNSEPNHHLRPSFDTIQGSGGGSSRLSTIGSAAYPWFCF